MKKTLLISLIFTSLSLFSYGQKFESIYNHKNLDGWTIYGTEKWFVNDKGYLVSQSGPDRQYGYLATDKEYKNFVVKAQFLQTKDGNSGLFIHSSIEGTKISGWQAEVAPPNKHTGGIYESYGRGWLIKPDPYKDKYLKYGKWNEIKVEVKGDQINTWLNGHQMISLKDEKIGASKGKIALQIHSGNDLEIFWRKIKVKKLD